MNEEKKVYLNNGDEVSLISEIKHNGKTKFIVSLCEDHGEYGDYEELMIVDEIYTELDNTPSYSRKSTLAEEIKKLYKEKEDLIRDIKAKKFTIAPMVMPGKNVYMLTYNNEIETKNVYRVGINILKDNITYEYFGSDGYGMGKIYLTKEEAEIDSKKYKAQAEEKAKQLEKENYDKAKELIKKFEENNI